jgi:hypothetical protein
MKQHLVISVLIGLAFTGHAQQEQIAGKNWIVQESTDLKKNAVVVSMDSGSYRRFAFDSFVVQVCYEPFFGSRNVNWYADGKHLKLAMAMYEIESLTDTSMVIVQPGVMRTRFLSEAYLGCRTPHSDPIDTFNGKPVYVSTKFICPHYELSFYQLMHTAFQDEKPGLYDITFVVTDHGSIGNVVMSPSPSKKFQKRLLESLNASDHHWTPAYACGKPIQTRVEYKFIYKTSNFQFIRGSNGISTNY